MRRAFHVSKSSFHSFDNDFIKTEHKDWPWTRPYYRKLSLLMVVKIIHFVLEFYAHTITTEVLESSQSVKVTFSNKLGLRMLLGMISWSAKKSVYVYFFNSSKMTFST